MMSAVMFRRVAFKAEAHGYEGNEPDANEATGQGENGENDRHGSVLCWTPNLVKLKPGFKRGRNG